MEKTTDRFPGGVSQLVPAADADGIEGWAVTYRATPNRSGRIVVPGAFTDSLAAVSDLKPLPMGYEHSTFSGTNPIGRWHAWDDRPEGLLLTDGRISDTEMGRDVRTLVDDGVITGLSIGFLADDVKLAMPGEELEFETPFGKKNYGVDGDDPVVFVSRGQLLETSLVSAPADDDARMVLRQSLALAGMAETADFDAVVRSMVTVLTHPTLPALEREAAWERLAERYRACGEEPPRLDGQPPLMRYATRMLADAADALDELHAAGRGLEREGCAMLAKLGRSALPFLEGLGGRLPPELDELVAAIAAAAAPPDTAVGYVTAELRDALELTRGGGVRDE